MIIIELFGRLQPMLGSNKQLYGNIQEENLGSVQFSLAFDADTSLLSIQLIQAFDLPPADPTSGTTNPFVRLRLLPDKTNQLQTRVHKATLSPYFDETFIFEASQSHLRSRTLEVRVMHQNVDSASITDKEANVINGPAAGVNCTEKSSSCNSIGQIMLPLGQVDLSEIVTMWKGLSACENMAEVSSFVLSIAVKKITSI